MRKYLIILVDAVVPLALIVVAIMGMRSLILSRPEAQKIDRPPLATLVETIHIPETAPQVHIRAYGTVEPAREVSLRPQVEGLVVEQSDQLIAGGIVKEGEVLLRIDPRDYQYITEQREAALVKAQADLQMEEGRQIVAEREWELLGSTIPTTEISRDLALRVPILEEKKAAVRSAESQLEQARLNLERTTLRAPFNAIVIEESVDPGQYLSPQSTVARLAGTDVYYVEISLQTRYLSWIQIPSAANPNDTGSTVSLAREGEGDLKVEREGRVVGLLGDVDPNGRMARVRIALEDPLGLKTDAPLSEPFLVGDYVRATIHGPIIEHAIEIPRLALREDDEVWIMSPEKELEVHTVDVLHREEDVVIVKGGVSPGDAVIVSSIPEPIPGMPLTTDLSTESTF